MNYFGDFPEDATVYIPFNTFSSDDPQASVTITNLVDADVKVHKDGGLTQIATDGATVSIDFDSITGNHLVTIDTSVSADYATGSDYLVRMEGTTVDGGTINAWIGSFSIENRYMRGTDSGATAAALATVDSNVDAILVDTNSLNDTKIPQTLNLTASGNIGIDWANVENPTTALDLAGTDIQLCDTCTTNTDMRGTDSAATATALATAQSDLDTITGSDGVTLASTQGNSLSFQDITITAGDGTDNVTLAGSGSGDGLAFTRSGSGGLMETNYSTEFQAEVNAACDTAMTDYDAATGTELAAVDAKIDTIDTNVDAALADTNELQTDWANGGRLDLILDARASQTTADAIETDTQDLQTQIGTAGAGLTDLGGMSTAMKAEVNAEADTALSDYDPPTNAEMEARTPTAAQLAYIVAHAATAVPVTFTGGTTTTAVLGNVDGSAASSTDDVYNGRVLIFNAGTLDQQATDITDYDGTTTTATITAVTTAVTSGHTAILV